MRAWTLIIGLLMTVFLGGTGFAVPMSPHDCDPARGAVTAIDHSQVHHHSPAAEPALPDDCCSDMSLCRAGNCLPLVDLTSQPAIVPLHAISAFRPEAEPVLYGRAFPPPHGPPRSFLF